MTVSHTRSWYAASAGPTPEYPSLAGSHSADVCVIGGGFTGLSTALHLAQRGYSVVVLEAKRVGWGASGRNGGQLIGGISGEAAIGRSLGPAGEGLLQQMRWAGHDIIRQFIDQYHIDCELKWGYMDVAHKARQLADLERQQHTLASSGFAREHRLLDRDEVGELTGTQAYLGGLLNMGNGHLHPLKLCLGEARAASQTGVKLYENSRVEKIARGTVAEVHTGEGRVRARFVVLAGNAYHELDAGLRGTMLPVRSYIVATSPLSPSLAHAINPRDLAICDANYILHYYRLSTDRRLLFGGRCNYFGEEPGAIAAQLRPRMLKLYPQLAEVDIDYAWGGTIGVPVKRVPLMGRLAPNIFYSQGYSGHGVNVTHLAGQILADVVAGTAERFDVFANIKPVKLPGQARFGRAMVSLGMLYYGLRDKL